MAGYFCTSTCYEDIVSGVKECHVPSHFNLGFALAFFHEPFGAFEPKILFLDGAGENGTLIDDPRFHDKAVLLC